MYNRIIKKKIKIKDSYIGGDSSISVQSMTNTPSSDLKATITQIKLLQNAGCDIVRVSVPDEESADIFKLAGKVQYTHHNQHTNHQPSQLWYTKYGLQSCQHYYADT